MNNFFAFLTLAVISFSANLKAQDDLFIKKSNTISATEIKSSPNSYKPKTCNARIVPKSGSAIQPLDKTKHGYFVEKSGEKIDREGYKKADKLNGEVRIYTEGKIREISIYINDEKNGTSTIYFENGKIEMIGNYKKGEKDGEWKEYSSDGKLRSTKKYINGETQN